MEVLLNRNIWRLVRKLADSGQFYDEDDVVNSVLRDYIKRETDFAFEQEPPTKEYVAEAVLKLRPAIMERDVVSIYLFGSVLHGDANKDSDIDFMVDLKPDNENIITPIREVRELLEDRFDRAVDVVPHEAMTAKWRSRGTVANQTMRIF